MYFTVRPYRHRVARNFNSHSLQLIKFDNPISFGGEAVNAEIGGG